VEGAATAGQEADADGRETARADAGIG